MLSMESAFFLSNRWEFLSDDLVTYSQQRYKQSTDENIQMQSEIKLLERTNLNYCFNSKADNFNVLSNINMLPKLTKPQRQNVLQYFIIMLTCPCNVHPLTPHFYIVKLGFTGVYIIFLLLLYHID